MKVLRRTRINPLNQTKNLFCRNRMSHVGNETKLVIGISYTIANGHGDYYPRQTMVIGISSTTKMVIGTISTSRNDHLGLYPRPKWSLGLYSRPKMVIGILPTTKTAIAMLSASRNGHWDFRAKCEDSEPCASQLKHILAIHALPCCRSSYALLIN